MCRKEWGPGGRILKSIPGKVCRARVELPGVVVGAAGKDRAEGKKGGWR